MTRHASWTPGRRSSGSFYCLWRKGARFVVLNSALMTMKLLRPILGELNSFLKKS